MAHGIDAGARTSDAGGNELADCTAKSLLGRNSWLAMAGEGIGNAAANNGGLGDPITKHLITMCLSAGAIAGGAGPPRYSATSQKAVAWFWLCPACLAQ